MVNHPTDSWCFDIFPVSKPFSWSSLQMWQKKLTRCQAQFVICTHTYLSIYLSIYLYIYIYVIIYHFHLSFWHCMKLPHLGEHQHGQHQFGLIQIIFLVTVHVVYIYMVYVTLSTLWNFNIAIIWKIIIGIGRSPSTMMYYCSFSIVVLVITRG